MDKRDGTERTDERICPNKRSFNSRHVFQSITSSTQPWSQNIGPMIDTKGLKFIDMIGSDNGSREDTNVM